MPPENETRRLAKKIASAVPRLAKAANKKAAGPTKTNTGRKDSQGRTIWEGPRGGLFVMNGDKKITIAKQPNQVVPSRPHAPWTVLKAARKFKRGIFEDPITMQPTAKKHGIVLNGTRYSKESMAHWIGDKPHARQTVPHSRRPITNEERKAILGNRMMSDDYLEGGQFYKTYIRQRQWAVRPTSDDHEHGYSKLKPSQQGVVEVTIDAFAIATEPKRILHLYVPSSTKISELRTLLNRVTRRMRIPAGFAPGLDFDVTFAGEYTGMPRGGPIEKLAQSSTIHQYSYIDHDAYYPNLHMDIRVVLKKT